MAETCVVCGKKLGFLTRKVWTADDRAVCIDDAIEAAGTTSFTSITKKVIGDLTGEEVVKHYKASKKEKEEEIKTWQTLPLTQVATKISGLNLSKNEYAYYADNDDLITWSETRTKTTRVNYGGFTSTIHIAKGFNYRMGSISTDFQKTEYKKEIISGYVLLTNKRIIIANSENMKAYTFGRLLRAIPYSDGTILCSNSGKQVFLTGFGDATQFNIFLDRLLTEDNVLPKK